jgi:hypothetical protein
VNEKSNPNSFRTYLEVLHGQSSSAPTVGSGDPIDLLVELFRAGPQPIDDLRAAVGMDPRAFLNTIDTMTASDFIVLAGRPGEERVELTEAGRRVAQVRTAAS